MTDRERIAAFAADKIVDLYTYDATTDEDYEKIKGIVNDAIGDSVEILTAQMDAWE